MGAMVAKRDPRVPEKSDRTDSQPDRMASQPLRCDAKVEFLACVNEARTRLGWSIEAMARLAGCSPSAMSEALQGKESRNFAGHWMTALGPEFEDTYNRVVDERRGISKEARRARVAKSLGELVRRVVEDLEDISA